jgi:hypothetical protein
MKVFCILVELAREEYRSSYPVIISIDILSLKARIMAPVGSIEAVGLRRNLEHYKKTLRLKDDEIGFLRAHLSQLSEKIMPALPPSQEEAREKHWWRFWQRE